MVYSQPVRIDEVEVDGYPLIKYHGFIASNRTGGLVAANGKIDWMCMPNFDSAPILASILDRKRGGYFSIRPRITDEVYVQQYYKGLTNILTTEFVKEGRTILRVTDFIPTSEYSTVNFPEVHRFAEAGKSDVDVVVEFYPIMNYGRDEIRIRKEGDGYLFVSQKKSIGLVGNVPFKKKDGGVYSIFNLPSRSSQWFIMLYNVRHLDRITDYKSYERMEETSAFWKNWVSQGNYSGIYGETVIRSALTLKGLFYEPTGLMAAAPTASLPESIGGDRNWDYRFAWIRDTAYVVEALSMIGYKREATKFLYDLMERIQGDGDIKTIYTISGDGETEETTLDWEGYRNSRPVRIGNKASDQLQIDEYGSIVNAIYYFSRIGGLINSYLWDFVVSLLNKLKTLWKEKDSSLWEFRGPPQHYVYSKLMCWTAFSRAIEIANDLHFSAPIDQWKKTADEIKRSILMNGYDRETNSFTQYYGSKYVDASLLRLPQLGFLSLSDRRLRGTIKRIEDELMVDGYLFRRYLNDDGLKSRDNSFLLLSFWYVEDQILFNNLQKAREIFENLMEKSNDLGLFSEEVDYETGEMVGNFPQAITHLGVIRSAIKLSVEYKKNSRRVRPRDIL